jgi:hypothetical protein
MRSSNGQVDRATNELARQPSSPTGHGARRGASDVSGALTSLLAGLHAQCLIDQYLDRLEGVVDEDPIRSLVKQVVAVTWSPLA